jgi:hypothetical protein
MEDFNPYLLKMAATQPSAGQLLKMIIIFNKIIKDAAYLSRDGWRTWLKILCTQL